MMGILKLQILLIVGLFASWTPVGALHRPSQNLPTSVRGWRDNNARISTHVSFESVERETQKSLQVTGGAEVASANNSKQVALLVAIPTISYLLWTFREPLGAIFSKEKIQSKTLEILGKLDALPKLYSYACYVGGLAIWETIGLSTIPVETAAGIVFGWTGFFLSGAGKLIGAILAFLLGRHGALAEWIQSKLSSNSFLQLVSDSTEDGPLKVAVLMKMSTFPEAIKNYGLALLSPIKLWMFVVATTLHGSTFSALWTYFGVDTAARLQNSSLPPDRKLEFLLGAALVNGIVISPLSMAYWVKSLQKSKQSSGKKAQ